ncbi:MAG: T9SS type A sorting domain-containing protein [Ignavibacteria bacterium]|nr:T9SS type A sorting domain-containing protein [Ignavibacteria bacterium]
MKKTINLFHNMQYFLITLIVLFSAAMIHAQVTQEWVARYNMSADTTFFPAEIKTDAAGNIYIAGSKVFSNPSTSDCVLLKYNSSGLLQWARTYNGTGNGNDYIYSMALDNAGNIYVTGESYGGPVSISDCVTLKYDPSGTLLWQARYNSVYSDYAYSVAVDGLNNIYTAGVTNDVNGNINLLTIKYNTAGIQLWSDTYTYTDSSREDFPEISLNNSNEIYISTRCRNGSNNRWNNYLTLKYSPAGNRLWSAVYNGPSDSSDIPYCISTDAAGDVYVSGYSKGIGTGEDAALVKYSSSGVEQWVRRYNHSGNSNEGSTSVAIGAGYVYLSGQTKQIGGNQDALLLKYNLNGTLQWAVTYIGPGNDEDGFSDIIVDNAGYIYAGGYTESAASLEDYLTIKYTPSGTIQWLKTYEGGINSEETISCIASDAQNNIFVTGASYNGNEYDITTVKYSQVTGVTPVSSEIPKTFSLSQNYPNPFNPSTTINFSIPVSEHVKLRLFDLLGKEVSVFVNETLAAGQYKADFDASAFSSGVYFYVLESGSFKETRKMILTK